MEKENRDDVIFYGPLPVDRPCPVPKPNSRIQLAPTVYPIALVPYVADAGEEAAPDEEELEQHERKLAARMCGLLMFAIVAVSAVMFILASVKPFPVQGKAGKVMNLGFYTSRFGSAFRHGSAFADAFPAGLVVIGIAAFAVNMVCSVAAMISGKRIGYGICAFVTFMTFAVAALYRIGIFSADFASVPGVLNKEYGWASVMLLIIGSANALAAFLCACFCPKNPVVNNVDL